MLINIRIKKAGRKGGEIACKAIELGCVPQTVGELIEYISLCLYKQYVNKAEKAGDFEEGDLTHTTIMSEEEIEEKAAGGKVDFDFPKMMKNQSEIQVTDLAKQSFSDGETAVFIDGQRCERLSDKINLSGGETVTFVKLTMLTGRLW